MRSSLSSWFPTFCSKQVFFVEKYLLCGTLFDQCSLFQLCCKASTGNQKTGFEVSARSSTLTLLHVFRHNSLSPQTRPQFTLSKPWLLYQLYIFDITSSWLYVRDPSIKFCAYTLSPFLHRLKYACHREYKLVKEAFHESIRKSH